ncbi:putative invertase inhibitor [Carex littledalei]|uniref:Putative invertase inhibitor n=1 Tax=Carex littledalei TaxID=544730 RepID=A0A833R685_9POAL|nr:putative invertase inhibitor [Carex littledalei]
MNSSVLLLCLFSFLLLSSLPFSLCEETTSQTTTPLDHLCNNLGGFYVTPDYCFTAFAADSRSRTADYNFLALISLNLTISNATDVRSNINSLLTSTTFSSTTPSSEPVRKGLQTCLKLYDDVISSLRWSAQSVSAGRYDGAKPVVEQAVGVPASCDAMPGLQLSKKNDGFSRIALLSEAVVSYLAN